jgi:aconitate hydratase
VAGPRRPQDRVALGRAAESFRAAYPRDPAPARLSTAALTSQREDADGEATTAVLEADVEIDHGAVVIAAITSCTNTSNPSVMVAAGLLARNAVAAGLESRPWVKTSLAPGSRVVTEYLTAAGLLEPLERLNFDLVGYGCTTCIGNSGPLPDAVAEAIDANDLAVCAVLSGNRNFEGRIHPQVRASYLASPPLVVAYALAGRIGVDLTTEPLGTGSDGEDVYLSDIWPSPRRSARSSPTPSGRRCSRSSTPASGTATSTGRPWTPRPAPCSAGTPTRPTCGSRRTSST